MRPEQQTIGQGEEVTLTCSASGDPRPTITWTKVGEQLSASPRISIEGDNLRIRGAAVSDRGMFLCTATSPGGSARASGIVEVEPREAPRLEVYPQAEQTISPRTRPPRRRRGHGSLGNDRPLTQHRAPP